jgi:predicted DCC family thiol-disulfide oxidoreductase YuxK
VGFLLKQDIHKRLSFATIQSDFAQQLILSGQFGFIEAPESVLFYDGNRIFTKSDAVFEALKQSKGRKRWLSYFRIIPKILRDFVYDIVARNRYKWFGKTDSCMLPPENWKERFLG